MGSIAEDAASGQVPIRDLVERFYGPEGPLAAAGWEVRPQQREMSLDIAERYDQGKGWVCHQAPTGTGKGLAYLVPGILAALREETRFAAARAKDPEKGPTEPRKLVVSTANIPLQEQLITKDIPAIAKMLGVDVRARLLKGRSNYVCRKDLHVLDGDLLADPDMQRILGWSQDPDATGDKEDLTWDPGSRLWGRISRTAEECSGQKCGHYAYSSEHPCFWRMAIRGWQKAHVVVVNHHLLTLHKAIPAAVLAVDEMHELESSVRGSVSRSLTAGAGRSAAKVAAKLLGSDEARLLIEEPVVSAMEVVERAYTLRNAGKRWPESLVLKQDPETGLSLPGMEAVWVERLQDAVSEIEQIARSHGGFLVQQGYMRAGVGDDSDQSARLYNRLYSLLGRLHTVVTGAPPDTWPGSPWAIYAEVFGAAPGRAGTCKVEMAPADVSWAIGALQAHYPRAACASATVPEWESLALTYGMGRAAGQNKPWEQAKRLPSPYDLANAAILVVPTGPEPKAREWAEWAKDQVIEAVDQAQGRTLVLASSIRQMRSYAEALRYTTKGWDVRMQGESGRGELRRWFAEEVDGVLVGTRSFFQGLDVQGASLSCVVIDRIPFARPGDPVEEAIQSLLIERNGGRGSGYMLRSVPDAAMVLAQGAGRLIRSVTDRGALVVLDTRLRKPGGGWGVLRAALPPFPTSYDLDDVGRVLRGEAAQGIPAPPRIRSVSARRW